MNVPRTEDLTRGDTWAQIRLNEEAPTKVIKVKQEEPKPLQVNEPKANYKPATLSTAEELDTFEVWD
jgi:hypothetical protein